MSIQYCHYCDAHIDLDFDSSHFDTKDKEEDLSFCIMEEQELEKIGCSSKCRCKGTDSACPSYKKK